MQNNQFTSFLYAIEVQRPIMETLREWKIPYKLHTLNSILGLYGTVDIPHSLKYLVDLTNSIFAFGDANKSSSFANTLYTQSSIAKILTEPEAVIMIALNQRLIKEKDVPVVIRHFVNLYSLMNLDLTMNIPVPIGA